MKDVFYKKEKQKLFRKERFAKVFRNISISTIFLNRKILKKLVVKTKIASKTKTMS